MKMSVFVNNNGIVELRTQRRDYNDALRVLERLKDNAKLRNHGKSFEVYMGMSEVKKDQELTKKVCEVLKRMHEEAVSEGKEGRARSIAKAMTKLNCPTQSPRTQ
ncbi:hypothetical protein [Vulcanisaeta sp. JCM 16161]|uniref:hypothetical protein n=1 Tax=Vulcanisaeta sp. JCM 16161 TaxID=1295372 RepID=UPI001FB43F7A|nr:hypothetical protein [Vulcanisaeta sp. JCM 16161]